MTVETTQKQEFKYACYIFRTHGPRYLENPYRDPAYRDQKQAVGAVVDQINAGASVIRPVWYTEYRRSISNLDSLPILKALLEDARQRETFVFVDDLRRLFARCAVNEQVALLQELNGYGDEVFVTRHMRKLSAYTPNQALICFLGDATQGNPKFRRRSSLTESERRDQTSAATLKSARVRQSDAQTMATKLVLIRDTLRVEGKPPSLRAIAEAANAQGLRTARGTLWSEPTVCRALKRVAGDNVTDGSTPRDSGKAA